MTDRCLARLRDENSLIWPMSAMFRALSKALSCSDRGSAFMFLRMRVNSVSPRRNRSPASFCPIEPLSPNSLPIRSDLIGKLFGDKGSIGQKLAGDLLRRGLTLFTRIRKNMKALPLSLQDKALLKARNMADIGQIKEFSSLNLAKHRSVINAFVHIIAAITAYQINPFKPKLNLQLRYQLETAA